MHTLDQLLSGQLHGTKHLKLSCGLTEIPDQVFDLADTLEVLDLSRNKLTTLPEKMGRLSKLRIAFFSDNDFTEFPDVLANCASLEMIGFKSCKIDHVPAHSFPKALRWLILTNNRIPKLPSEIGQCRKLQKLMLAGNQLRDLPKELSQCGNLELLRISANLLEHLPDWLLQMPRLSWLAFAGNPFQKVDEDRTELKKVLWQHLQVAEKLGEGASGDIYKASWKVAEDRVEQVAVKVFKGAMTSDGTPLDEMQACIRAGEHPHLVKVLAEVLEHPQGRPALLFQLLPPDFSILGLPPSFESCTRDLFPENRFFAIGKILHMARGIAYVTKHLHEKGILHGDLYAHNILVNDVGYPLLSDFGAASLYDKLDMHLADRLEKLEVRAFGCFLEDLLQRAIVGPKESETLHSLIRIKDSCFNDNLLHRPALAQLAAELNAI